MMRGRILALGPRSWMGAAGLALRLVLVMLASTACGTGEAPLPPDLQNPSQVQTAAGAMAFYREVVASVPELLDATLTTVAIITDELAALPLPVGVTTDYTAADSRQDLGLATPMLYGKLHWLRAQAREARGFLDAYAPDTTPALSGHLYAVEGYAELVLADLFCSGIPLSTVDFRGDYTLTPGLSTAEVYDHAITLFDSALARTGDSLSLQVLAAVGRGRALLATGRYADAAAAVAAVPDGYTYQVVLTSGQLANFATWYTTSPGTPGAADREGGNGLDYRSSGDPRTATQLLGQDVRGFSMYFPLKYYPPDAPPTLTLASAVEARLIEAESALQGGGDWLARLNALRTDGTFDTQPNAADPAKTDTVWHAGTGGVPGLRPLNDPSGDAARIDLLFRERAFWLYLTGHRQGDLRRLVRQYGREPDSVYPHGFYPGGTGQYGSEIVAPVPDEERKFNPKYSGCINRNA